MKGRRRFERIAMRQMTRISEYSNADRRRGSALVEFAVMTPFLLLLLAGVLDYGRLCVRPLALPMQRASARSTVAAASQDLRIRPAFGRQPSIRRQVFPGCRSARFNLVKCPGGASVSCSGSCGSGELLMYVKVTVTAASSAIFSYSGLGFTGNISRRATMRVQ